MTSVITNESEHRRGLVLGLTLAEVLLLLLFLILLAFGARLIKNERNLKAAELKVEAASNFFAKLEKGADPKTLLADLARIRPLEEQVKNLTNENARLKTELAAEIQKSTTIERAVSAANSIDPNDSPAILKVGKDMVEALGRKVDPQKIQILSELGSSLDKSSKDVREKVAASIEEIKAIIEFGGRPPGINGHQSLGLATPTAIPFRSEALN